jgi:hypothetical protein
MTIRKLYWDEPTKRSVGEHIKGRRASVRALRASPARQWHILAKPVFDTNRKERRKASALKRSIGARLALAAEALKADRANRRFMLGRKAKPNTFTRAVK